jgi:hypothetical protein
MSAGLMDSQTAVPSADKRVDSMELMMVDKLDLKSADLMDYY